MKFLAASVVSLFATLALAHGEVQINWPSVSGLAINNACATEDTLCSVTGVKACTATKLVRYGVSSQGEVGLVKRQLKDGEQPRQYEYLQTEEVCSAYGIKNIEVSRMVTVTECAYYPRAGENAEPCKEFISKSVKSGLKFSVEKLVEYGDATTQTFINYTIPFCR